MKDIADDSVQSNKGKCGGYLKANLQTKAINRHTVNVVIIVNFYFLSMLKLIFSSSI